MICCCVDSKNLCEDYSCDVQKNETGIVISLSSEKKDKVDALHQMVEAGKNACCGDGSNKDAGKCC